MHRRCWILVSCFIVTWALPVQANLLTNGSFETGTDPVEFHQVSAGQGDISNWTVVSGEVDYIGGHWHEHNDPYTGSPSTNRSLDMAGTDGGGGVTNGSIRQTITTQVGAPYWVTFWLATNPTAWTGSSYSVTMDVSAAGKTTGYTATSTQAPTGYYTGPTYHYYGLEWTRRLFTFTASSTQTDLVFTSTSYAGLGAGAALDDISVETNPEPGTFALFGLGIGVLAGWRVRHRRRAARSA